MKAGSESPPFWRSLYFKLAAGLAVILLVVGLSYTLFASYMLRQINPSTQQALNHNLAQNLVDDKKIVHDGRIDEEAMKHTFMQYMTINPSIEIYYLDLEGNILSYSAEPDQVKRDSVSLEPILKSLANPRRIDPLGDDPRSHEMRKPFSVTPIPSAENPQGYLYVVLQSQALSKAIDMQAQHSIIRLGGVVIGGSLLIALLIGLLLFHRFHRRVQTLQQQVADFVASDFSSPPQDLVEAGDDAPGDEIHELERHIRRMTRHIRQQWSALKQQDKLRREMVANISHDLRTPLASIQGYLETLRLKYDRLDDARKQEYLAVAARQADNLQKLIDSLFELARLEASGYQPEMQPFSLLELVHDVIAKFQIRAEEKGIRLKLNSVADNPVVYADIGLIEQVLDNLIGNAIHYSPRDGEIEIRIDAPTDGSLTVRIADQGEGIAREQLDLVFERFHQAHTPERVDGHAGLGLCIVKKIIELHRQKVWVESEPKQGARFHFTLSAVE
jgi:signal transduction histidine kinase